MAAPGKYRVVVGRPGADTEAERHQLAADLEEFILLSRLEVSSVQRESERPRETMAAGAILSFEMAERTGRKLLEALRGWLASRRTEIELQTPDGRKIKVSAANFEEAVQLMEQLRRG